MTPSDTPGDTLRLREIFTRQWHKWNDGRRAPWNGNISKSFDFTTSTDLGAFGPVSDRF